VTTAVVTAAGLQAQPRRQARPAQDAGSDELRPVQLDALTAAPGVDDALTINFWRDATMSADVVVRPDGKITLPLINELQANGLTPDQLRAAIVKASMKFLTEEPTVSVIVKQINSRYVFINGQVGKTGPYMLKPHRRS
jgi:polysaccharide export outer membrane protein